MQTYRGACPCIAAHAVAEGAAELCIRLLRHAHYTLGLRVSAYMSMSGHLRTQSKLRVPLCVRVCVRAWPCLHLLQGSSVLLFDVLILLLARTGKDRGVFLLNAPRRICRVYIHACKCDALRSVPHAAGVDARTKVPGSVVASRLRSDS